MGAYPAMSDPQSGCGPTKNFELLKKEYVFFKYLLLFYLITLNFFKIIICMFLTKIYF